MGLLRILVRRKVIVVLTPLSNIFGGFNARTTYLNETSSG
jgi:hypothetical protein